MGQENIFYPFLDDDYGESTSPHFLFVFIRSVNVVSIVNIVLTITASLVFVFTEDLSKRTQKVARKKNQLSDIAVITQGTKFINGG